MNCEKDLLLLLNTVFSFTVIKYQSHFSIKPRSFCTQYLHLHQDTPKRCLLLQQETTFGNSFFLQLGLFVCKLKNINNEVMKDSLMRCEKARNILRKHLKKNRERNSLLALYRTRRGFFQSDFFLHGVLMQYDFAMGYIRV